jgi:glycosyltransferase involved in cell wall biosynthesis
MGYIDIEYLYAGKVWLHNADYVLMASQATGEWINELYNNKINYVISQPSLKGLNITPRNRNIDREHIILFYARLAPQKGAELFVNAALRLLNQGIDPLIRFVVAGPDMKEAPGGGSWIRIYNHK